MDLTGVRPGVVTQVGDNFIYLSSVYDGNIKPKKLPLKTDRFKVGALHKHASEPPIGYVFKALDKVRNLGTALIFGTPTLITLENVLQARVPVKPLAKFSSWSYFEYSGMIEVVVFVPPSNLVERFEQ